jgi:hypothetical protein
VPAGGAAQVFGKFMRSERDKWAKVIKSANIQLQ